MRNDDRECRSGSRWTGNLSRLLTLSLVGCGTLFASIVLLVLLPAVLLVAIPPSPKIAPWLVDFLPPGAFFLSGVVTMLVARDWRRLAPEATVAWPPAPGAIVVVMRVLVVASLCLLALFVFIRLYIYAETGEYSLSPTYREFVCWVCWVVGGLLASFLGRGQRRAGTDCSAEGARESDAAGFRR